MVNRACASERLFLGRRDAARREHKGRALKRRGGETTHAEKQSTMLSKTARNCGSSVMTRITRRARPISRMSEMPAFVVSVKYSRALSHMINDDAAVTMTMKRSAPFHQFETNRGRPNPKSLTAISIAPSVEKTTVSVWTM